MAAPPCFRLELRDGAGGGLVVAAHGDHLGAAIARATKKHPRHAVIAAAPHDGLPIGEAVSKDQVVLAEEPRTSAALLALPRGLVHEAVAGGEAAPMTVGWVRRAGTGAGVVLEAQPAASRVHESWLSVVERLPSADNVEVTVFGHYDEPAATRGGAAIWLTSRIGVKQALRFLDDHEDILSENGHVQLAIYVRASRSTLRLTEHKTIAWLSEDEGTAATAAGWFAELGMPAVTTLRTALDVPHLHTRVERAGDRKKLEERLYRMRLRQVGTRT